MSREAIASALAAVAAVLAFACFVALLVLGFALALGCAVRPVDTQVRRVDSLGGVDQVGDELGADGWRIVELVPQGEGYVLVLQREVVR